jgi:hypothetical protein
VDQVSTSKIMKKSNFTRNMFKTANNFGVYETKDMENLSPTNNKGRGGGNYNAIAETKS